MELKIEHLPFHLQHGSGKRQTKFIGKGIPHDHKITPTEILLFEILFRLDQINERQKIL